MDSTSQAENMKVYRPKSGPPVFAFLALAVLALVVIFLGYQNITLRRELTALKDEKPTPDEAKKEISAPETLVLNQQNPTEDWRIYKNLTYGYKFRVPKVYQAKVNNTRNSVEIFNEGGQRTVEVTAVPKSDTNTGDDAEKKETVGNMQYNVFELPQGSTEIKSPYSIYKTSNDKYVFSLIFYNAVALDEMEKLILATFSEIE